MQSDRIETPTVSIERLLPRSDCGLFILRATSSDYSKLRAVIDREPISRAGSITDFDGGRLLWTRPGGWLAVLEKQSIAESLTSIDRKDCIIFNVMDAMVAYRFKGPGALQTLQHAGPLVSALSAVSEESARGCARLLMAQVPCLVEQTANGDYNTWIDSSVSGWWWQWWQSQPLGKAMTQ